MSVKDRPRLGRGLKSLITHPVGVMSPAESGGQGVATPLPTNGDRFMEVDVTLIDPNPHQPRGTFDSASLKELAASIRVSGILQPVIVKPVNGRYQLVAGHRRTEAARLAGLPTVPALLRHDSTEAQQAEWALMRTFSGRI